MGTMRLSNFGFVAISWIIILFLLFKWLRGLRMTPQELTLWAFALMILAVAVACTIVVGYVTFKVLCAIKEKGLQAIVDWFVC